MGKACISARQLSPDHHGHVTVTRNTCLRTLETELTPEPPRTSLRCRQRRPQALLQRRQPRPFTTMPKHSLTHPSVPASAPSSPVVTRKSERNPPATPQRSLPRPSVRHFQSPYTPATTLSTPYTPVSLRSAPSSNGSSLATPASIAGNNRRLSLNLSPEVSFQGKPSSKKSLADIADNWRTRANENGIKVAPSEESQFADDEGE